MLDKKLKLDLHTHCFETLGMVNEGTVKLILDKARKKGLDGIAVTEHCTFSFGAEAKEIAEKHLRSEIIVIPGREIGNFYHNFQINPDLVKRVAVEHQLVLLHNSDSHTLMELGALYTEISLTELAEAVMRQKFLALQRIFDWFKEEIKRRDKAFEAMVAEELSKLLKTEQIKGG